MTKEIASKENKNESIEVFFPHNPDTSRLLVGSSIDSFMASRIARAVEDADACLLNLNVTSLSSEQAQLVVALRVDHRNPERVARSLERYGYTVLDTDANILDDDTARRRYDELMKYLSL